MAQRLRARPSPRPTRRRPPARRRGAAPPGAFATGEVARILGVPAARLRSLVRAGICRPARCGHAWRFSFQDLVLLRAAASLVEARVPARSVRRALDDLTRQLPPGRPLTGVRICADGGTIIVRDGGSSWEPRSGQMLFSYDLDDLARRAGVVVPADERRRRSAAPRRREPVEISFEQALALEESDPEAARTTYRRLLEGEPDNIDAYVNLGRLTHSAGDLTGAVLLYQRGLERAPHDAILHYNLALVLEDDGGHPEAINHYLRALDADTNFADAHYNLARLLEQAGRHREALRHLAAYKRLTT